MSAESDMKRKPKGITVMKSWHPVHDGKHISNGREWKVSDLISAADRVPTVQLSIDSLLQKNRELLVKGRLLCMELMHPSAEFRKRASDADIAFPILVDSEGWVVDGAHRLARAKWAGMSTIGAKVVDLESITHTVTQA